MVNERGLLKLVPVIVTNVPTEPPDGENELIVGVWAETKLDNSRHNSPTINRGFFRKRIMWGLKTLLF